jgi:hypothetical protein
MVWLQIGHFHFDVRAVLSIFRFPNPFTLASYLSRLVAVGVNLGEEVRPYTATKYDGDLVVYLL